MAEWQFPNAIAEQARREAEFNGQHANRLQIRDWDDKWPQLVRVEPGTLCPRGIVTAVLHDPEPSGLCKTCGALVGSR